MTDPVKSRRRYDSSTRRTDARARREAVLTAARQLLLQDGFAPTTVSAVAGRAGVSEEMVYKNFGGKAGLVRALYAEALLGEGPVPAERRSESLRESGDAREVVRGWAILSMEVASRVSPIALLVRDAALVDPRMGGLLAELDDRRHARMADNAQFLCSAGHLRPEVTEGEATDLMWSVTSPEMFDLLVRRRGWSLEQYAGFVYRTIAYGLLGSA